MDVERIEITSAGLFALLREDFTELATAATPTLKVQLAAKVLRRVNQINRIADTVTGKPTVELGYAVERLGQVLVSQAQRRMAERRMQSISSRQSGGTPPLRPNRQSA
jgi:hypothetical protein